MPQPLVTLSYANKFGFTCPIFDAKTSMGSCMKLRDIVWKGQGIDKRQGCQVAMKCGKCPAAALVSMHIYNKNWDNDFHGATEPKEGKLHAAVLAKVENVMIQDSVMNKHAVSAAEKTLLLSASDRIRAQLKTAPGEAPARASDYTPPRKQKASAAPAKAQPSKLEQAAQTGDLAAAISA
ncbi:hypothetical protein [Mesorhizobium sp.]|uniref:hypothetical protein n=1 Tax=Mesorhizobium sp. TaxID=1871066 RepID=UPI000FE6B209|nr:hypothetical protein [Mesorhizobium sp.]RWI35449.1 MAG: hypothetical protein EOR14_28520 [Mesorhizobium sp.]RWJ66382.1 MAG: hypothetical protein EOR34_28615 [Mesorhizobium sp.]